MPADKILRRLLAAAAMGASAVVYARARRPRAPAAAPTRDEAEAVAAAPLDGPEAREGHSPRLVDEDERGGRARGGTHEEPHEPPRLDPDAPPAVANDARPAPAHPYKDQGDPLDPERRP